MLSPPIGRLRFFLYSVAIAIAELIAVALCVAATTGFGGLARSQPGPSREGLALASFLVMMVFAVARANITWRRGEDADLSKWLIVPYIVSLVLLAVLQATTLLIYDFKTGDTNIGLGILSTAMFGLWFRICFASSKESSFDPDSFLTAEGFGQGPSGGFRQATTASVSAGTSMMATPVTVGARGHGNAGGIAFGKRAGEAEKRRRCLVRDLPQRALERLSEIDTLQSADGSRNGLRLTAPRKSDYSGN
jgi:uncharacterized membrane protein YhaH (DUF805 family)